MTKLTKTKKRTLNKVIKGLTKASKPHATQAKKLIKVVGKKK